LRALELTREPWALAVCRLDPGAPIPEWATRGAFHAAVRTPGELSIVCASGDVPAGVRAEKGWRCFSLRGPIAFEETGVLAAIAAPLAAGRIPIFALSTFDTDYVLVKAEDAEAARRALERAGHICSFRPPSRS
jgi:hypothetical protein